MNDVLEKYKSFLSEAAAVGGPFDFHTLPIDFERHQDPSLAEFSLSLPFKVEGLTFICIPLKDEDVIHWCFGDMVVENPFFYDDLSAVVFPLIEGVTQVELGEMTEERGDFLTKLFASTPIIFTSTNGSHEAFEKTIFPIFRALQHRPSFKRQIKRSSGVIRRDFEKSLLLNNETLAIQYLNEWKSGQRLDAENLQYLHLYMNLKLGKYEYIFENDFERLKLIQHLEIPLTIKHCVTEALFELFVKPCLQITDWRRIKSHFAEERVVQLKVFFDSQYIHSRAAFALCLCCEIANKDVDLKNLDWLCNRPELRDIQFVQALKSDFLTEAPQVNLRQQSEDFQICGQEAFENFRYDDALKALLKCDPLISNLRMVAECLNNLADIETLSIAASDVVQFYDSAESSVKQTLKNNAPAIVQTYEALKEKHPQSLPENASKFITDPGGWTEWFDFLETELDVQKCKSTFLKYYKSWPVDSIVGSVESARKFSARFNILVNDQKHADLINELFTNFIDVIVLDDENFNEYGKPVYYEFLQFVSLRAEDIDLQIVTEIESVLFRCRLTNSEITSSIELLRMAFDNNNTFKNFDIFLDTAEQIALNVQPNNPEALNYFSSLIALATRFSRRLDAEQLHTLALLHQDFAQEMASVFSSPEVSNEDEGEEDLLSTLDFRVAIYSLEEHAASRAADYLRGRFPRCSVTLNSDKQCTERLKHLAKNVDYFVFATRASKHQAFYCVKDTRPGDKTEILMPLGKGTSSILNILMEQIVQN